MAEITTTQSFSDGDTVTATKLNNIQGNASIQPEAITNRTAETTIDQANDLLLIYDASATSLKKITPSNLIKAGTASDFPVTGNATIGGNLSVTGNSVVKAGTAASPAIQPTGDTNTGIFFPAADTIAFSEGGAESMRIDSSGNVGIGTSSPATQLQINSGATTYSDQLRIRNTNYGNADIGVGSGIMAIATDTANITFHTSSNLGATGSAVPNNERLRIDSSGNVGIGTTSPNSRLSITTSAATIASFDSTATDGGYITFSRSAVAKGYIGISSPLIANTFNNDLGIRSDANLILATGGNTERLRIDSSGNVGIGTSSPAAILEVASATPKIKISAISNASAQLLFNSNASGVQKDTGSIIYSNAESMIFQTSSTERLRIDSSGNVGIGTASPSQKLTVFSDDILGGVLVTGSNAPAIRLNDTTDGSTYSAIFAQNNGVLVIDADVSNTAANSYLGLNVDATERLRITSGGEVYIAGTTDQGAYNLQVNGTGVWGAGAYVNGSDSRIKEDIQPIASGLDVVDKLNPVTYKYKETWSSDQSIQSGFIAQELLTALDGQIYIDGVVQQGGTDGYYSVAYQNLIPILAKAIQELKSENDSLKSRITALEAA